MKELKRNEINIIVVLIYEVDVLLQNYSMSYFHRLDTAPKCRPQFLQQRSFSCSFCSPVSFCDIRLRVGVEFVTTKEATWPLFKENENTALFFVWFSMAASTWKCYQIKALDSFNKVHFLNFSKWSIIKAINQKNSAAPSVLTPTEIEPLSKVKIHILRPSLPHDRSSGASDTSQPIRPTTHLKTWRIPQESLKNPSRIPHPFF